MQLYVVTPPDGILQLPFDFFGMKIVATDIFEVFLESQDFGDIGHNGQFGSELIEKTKQAVSRLHHQGKRAAVPVAVDLVVECEDCF